MMRRIAAAAVFLLLATAGMAGAAERVALVIGNGAYAHAGPLPNPPNDARAISARLRGLGFEVIEGIDLDQQAMRTSLRDFANALAGARVALFFYAGHGLQVDGTNYLVPVDARLEDKTSLSFEAVSADFVLRLMEEQERTNLIFLDACRNNPLARNLARSMGTRSASIGRGLAQMQGGIGTLITYATQPGNVAYDGDGSNSPFTTAILEHIEKPGVEVRQMLTRVRQSVIQQTGGEQVPWDHSSLTGDFFFVAPGDQPAAQQAVASLPQKPAPAPAATAAGSVGSGGGDAMELAFWNAVAAANTESEYRAYMQRYPDGVFVPLAKSRLASLQPAPAAVPKAAEPPPVVAASAATEDALRLGRTDRREIQERLTVLGFDTRGVDGAFGPGTRAAIAEWQGARGHVPTGFLDDAQLAALEAESEADLAAFRAEQRQQRIQAPQQVQQPMFRAQSYCSMTGASGFGQSPNPQQAMMNAAQACMAQGGIPQCCINGTQLVN